jgi:hypothetical protein
MAHDVEADERYGFTKKDCTRLVEASKERSIVGGKLGMR